MIKPGFLFPHRLAFCERPLRSVPLKQQEHTTAQKTTHDGVREVAGDVGRIESCGEQQPGCQSGGGQRRDYRCGEACNRPAAVDAARAQPYSRRTAHGHVAQRDTCTSPGSGVARRPAEVAAPDTVVGATAQRGELDAGLAEPGRTARQEPAPGPGFILVVSAESTVCVDVLVGGARWPGVSSGGSTRAFAISTRIGVDSSTLPPARPRAWHGGERRLRCHSRKWESAVYGALVGTLSNKKEFPTTTSSSEVADHREGVFLQD